MEIRLDDDEKPAQQEGQTTDDTAEEGDSDDGLFMKQAGPAPVLEDDGDVDMELNHDDANNNTITGGSNGGPSGGDTDAAITALRPKVAANMRNLRIEVVADVLTRAFSSLKIKDAVARAQQRRKMGNPFIDDSGQDGDTKMT